MTETTRPARANRDGHPCPPWCTVDHDEQLVPGHFTESHGDEGTIARAGEGSVFVRACFPPSREPLVQIVPLSGSIFVTPPDAEHVARMVEDLAGATPDEARALAAVIRRAAAQVTEARDG